MVGRYIRKIESVKDNIENSIKISGILLKLKEHHGKLAEIDMSSVSSNLEKMEDNFSDITSNRRNIA